MQRNTHKLWFVFAALATFGLSSCSDKDDSPDPADKPLRARIEYSTLTPATVYWAPFVDESGKPTVDLAKGNIRLNMFRALDSYIKSSITENKQIDAAVLKNMFTNTGNPFTDSTRLNASGLQLRNTVAASWADGNSEVVRKHFETLFDQMAEVSKAVTATAEQGKAGKIGNYLVDAKGLEPVQLIQKALIGALQYDHIGNVLLTKGLDADNKTVVSGKNYTQLEQNWDEAYGLLTTNPIYLEGSTDSKRGTAEFALGSYIWEYNKEAYAKIHPAFLKGRAAIVNNDKAELKVQADFIRAEMEKAIASSAINYLGKYLSATSDAARVHAIGEGLGFIYSLRFATVNGGDAAFSDTLLAGLVGSANGVWDLTPAKITAATNAIKTKFKL